MNTLTHHPLASIPMRLAIGTLILIALVILGIAVSHAGETHDAVVAQTAPVSVVERPETLPQTASNQPWIALLGCLAFGAAGALAVGRRHHLGAVTIREWQSAAAVPRVRRRGDRDAPASS